MSDNAPLRVTRRAARIIETRASNETHYEATWPCGEQDSLEYIIRREIDDLVTAATDALALIEGFDSEAKAHGGDDCGWPEQIAALKEALT